MGAPAHNLAVSAHDAVALGVEAEDADSPLSLVVGTTVDGSVVHDICLTVVVEEERGVDTVDLRQADGVAPAHVRVFGLHEEVAHAHAGGDHVVSFVFRIVLDVGGKDAARHTLSVQGQLRGAVEHMAYLRPVHQVFTLEDGHAGEECERRVDQIELIAHPAERRVGIETRQNGVEILVGRVVLFVEAGVVARVLKVSESGLLRRSGQHRTCYNC